MAHTQDSVTVVWLLCEHHEVASLWHLAMEMAVEGGKKKVSFCPFCQYMGSNDMSYLNHIVIAHYNVSYGCGKCLTLAFKSRWLQEKGHGQTSRETSLQQCEHHQPFLLYTEEEETCNHKYAT